MNRAAPSFSLRTVSNPFSRPTRAQLFRWVAAISLLAGYADLANGGLTLAPVLLTAAYVVLVPLALLTR